MIWLFLSILTSVMIFVAFKLIAKNNVPMLPAIVVNYTVCVIEGAIAQGSFPSASSIVTNTWFTHALMIGGLFISVFYLMGLTVKYAGLAVSSIANKLSLIIPVTAAYFLYDDPFTPLKIGGIAVAMVAVVFASYKKEESGKPHNFNYYFFPLLVLIGSGVIDTFTKWNQENFLDDTDFNLFLIFVFGTAAAIGWMVLFYRYIYLREKVTVKSIGYGLLLGIPNYGSLYFLIRTLDLPGWESSTVFPVNNIAIVAGTCLVAYFVFREKLLKVNVAGIILAMIAILMIMKS